MKTDWCLGTAQPAQSCSADESTITSQNTPPTIRLQDVHPELIPFLSVPRHIPLRVFLLPSADTTPSRQPGSPDAGCAVDAAQEAEENAHGAHTVMARNVSSITPVVIEDTSPVAPEQTIATPHLDPPTIPPPHTRTRRCIVCLGAGRMQEALKCPGRVKRTYCTSVLQPHATAVGEGATPLPPAWPIPGFIPVPILVPIRSLLGVAATSSRLPSAQMVANGSQLPLSSLGSVPAVTSDGVQSTQPHPGTPTFLSDKVLQSLDHPQCLICLSKNQDGSTCIGRTGLLCPSILPVLSVGAVPSGTHDQHTPNQFGRQSADS